jgi:iron complex outermembrane recepter protein
MRIMSRLHSRHTAAWILIGIVSIGGAVDAQSSAQLTGSVRDATGLPLAGARVSLRGAGNRITQTDADGRFAFQGLPEGEYHVTATLSGFASAEQTSRLTSGQHAFVSLTLTVLILEQAVVTATKAGEANVQSIPMAVSVLSGTELARMDDRTVEAFAARAPGVTFSQNTVLAQVTIRGIGTNAVFAGSDPSSAVYLDGVYLARPAMVLAEFLDLDRVEVLRGPQGTLYGRNSLGGAINVISRVPTSDVDATARVGVGDRGAWRTGARVSGPIVRGRLMGSGAFLRSVRGGIVQDLDHPDHRLGGEDVIAARGQLRFVIDRRSELMLAADSTVSDPAPLYYSKILAAKPGFVVDNPAALHDVRASFPAEGRIGQSGVSARVTVDLTPSLRLTSLSAYRRSDLEVLIDGDISELDLNYTDVDDAQHQWSEELTLVHRRPRLTWIAGLFLFDESDRQVFTLGAPAARRENRLGGLVDADARALFAQTTIEVSPRVDITAGFRYTHERKTIDNSGRVSTLDPPITILPGAYQYTDAIVHDAWTPKIGADVRLREHMLAYASATRGFKSGGFNLSSPEAGRGFAPEWAWSYETGLKTEIARARARVNVAAFYTDYTDLQVQTGIRPGVIDISNAAAATIKGVEVEATTRLGGAVQIGGHLAWLDARYDHYLAFASPAVTTDVAGRSLNNAPDWSGRTWVDWTYPIGRRYALSLRADSTWKTTVFYTPFNDPVQRQGALGLLDVSAEVGPRRRRWSINLYARNLTNQDFITGSVSTPPPAIGGRPGASRQVGVHLEFVR